MSHEHLWTCSDPECGAMMSEQPRNQAGAPNGTGGQFATTPRSEADVRLVAVPTGSFHYPPFLHNADEAIAFWESVEIPDDVITAFRDTWASDYDFFASGKYAVWVWDEAGVGRTWDEENPEPSDPDEHEQWQQRRDERRAEVIDRTNNGLAGRPPKDIDPRDARTLIKVLAMYDRSGDTAKNRDERAKLSAHEFETTQGPITAGKIWDRWVRHINLDAIVADTIKKPTPPPAPVIDDFDIRVRQAVADIVDIYSKHLTSRIDSVHDRINEVEGVVYNTTSSVSDMVRLTSGESPRKIAKERRQRGL